jgi:hypothetical protein
MATSRRRELLLRALPAIAFLATFGVFFVDKNEEARSVFRAGRGLLTVAVLVGGYLVLAFVLRRFVRWAWVAPAVLTVVILVLAAWIVRPYYVDETDNTKLVEGPIADASDQPPATDATPGESETQTVPVRVASGALQGLTGHDASGTVELIRNADGTHVVRFSAFGIEGTPDPIVYLIQGDDQRSPGGSNLGGLRGNVGDASDYAVPADVQPGAGWTVLVWCGQFTVEIANATLNAT